MPIINQLKQQQHQKQPKQRSTGITLSSSLVSSASSNKQTTRQKQNVARILSHPCGMMVIPVVVTVTVIILTQRLLFSSSLSTIDPTIGILPEAGAATLSSAKTIASTNQHNQHRPINFQEEEGKQQQHPLLFHYVHTSKGSDLTHRNIHCIESVFYHHPTAHVIIHIPQDEDNIGLHTDLSLDDNPILFQSLISKGDSSSNSRNNNIYNITVQPFQLKSLIDNAIDTTKGSALLSEKAIAFEGTSTTSISINELRANQWYDKIPKYFLGKNWYVDVSDLARLLILYTYGGTYLDTDVVVTQPLTVLKNTIGFERQTKEQIERSEQGQEQSSELHGEVNNAVLINFEIGNEFIGDCINEYFLTFQSSTHIWGYVGPRLFQRVLLRSKYRYYRMSLNNEGVCKVLSQPIEIRNYVNPDINQTARMNQLRTIPPRNHNCPVIILWKDAFYIDIASNECLSETPETQLKKKRIDESSVFVVHLSNQKTKNAVKEQIKKLSSNNTSNNDDITKLLQQDTLCNWLYNAWCATCDGEGNTTSKNSNSVQLWEDLLHSN